MLAAVNEPFPDPRIPLGSRAEVLGRYLGYFRARVLAKVESLPDDELRRSRLPSGWTPLELLKHLAHTERRWLEWRFEGRDISDPWGDGDRWHVEDGETVEDLKAALRAQGERSHAIIGANDLQQVGAPGPGWDGADPATLERVVLHLIQEYARHLGHLDIVAELAGGELGE
jgi:uncharacterized damage-inducible protein DinB